MNVPTLAPPSTGMIRVLVVDDSVVIRKILTDALAADPDVEVVGTAANGRIALGKLDTLKPDLVTLDVEMPEMDGLATLREIRKVRPKLPVIMFSTLTARGASATLDALSAGANDYVTKPANVGSVTAAIARIREELIPKIKALCNRAGRPAAVGARAAADVSTTPVAAAPVRLAAQAAGRMPIEVVVIGISTGGPNALAEIMPAMPAHLPVPILIVQHMPPVFTRLLAERLSARCPLTVGEAIAGEPIVAGRVYVAPGDFHMFIERSPALAVATGPRRQIALNQGAPENSCRPAVDVLFRSAATVYGSAVLAVVLTGMGSDGLHGCEAIRAAGGTVLAQDEATSTVWGMPGFVARAGLAEQLLPLGEVAASIARRVHDSRAPRRAMA
jgi:two-component system chemotaxis response regulator CheB